MKTIQNERAEWNSEDDVLVFNSGVDNVNLHQHIEGDSPFLNIVRNNY